jgi:hypothetical protein
MESQDSPAIEPIDSLRGAAEHDGDPQGVRMSDCRLTSSSASPIALQLFVPMLLGGARCAVPPGPALREAWQAGQRRIDLPRSDATVWAVLESTRNDYESKKGTVTQCLCL